MSSTPQTYNTARRSLHARRLPLANADRQLMKLGELRMGKDFQQALTSEGLWPLQPTSIDVLQINVGKLCNQTCRHCHVDAGPDRTEVMSRETAEECVAALRRNAIPERRHHRRGPGAQSQFPLAGRAMRIAGPARNQSLQPHDLGNRAAPRLARVLREASGRARLLAPALPAHLHRRTTGATECLKRVFAYCGGSTS